MTLDPEKNASAFFRFRDTPGAMAHTVASFEIISALKKGLAFEKMPFPWYLSI